MGRPRSRAPAVSWIAPALAGKPAEERQATPTEVLLQDKSGSSKSPARGYYMNKPLRILILEDQPADAELVTCELRKAGLEFVAKTVATENEFLAELRNSAPELILADYSLPGYHGLSALAAAQKQCPETPFIFVSGTLGEEKAIETLHLGATDYVLKQRLAQLGRVVQRALRERETIRMVRQAEQSVRELNLMLRATGAINALIVRERDPQRLLAEACHILVETRGYRFAWIGQVEPGSKRVVPMARAGKDADYLDAVTITWDETPTGQGPIGTAIRTGQPVVSQDMASEPRFAPWKAAAMARGFASMAMMPMIHGSRVLGAVAVYSGHTGAFHEEELELLQELAADLALALQSIEHEQERKRAEEHLRQVSNRLLLATEAAGIGIWDLDLLQDKLVWDDAMYRLYGISPEQSTGAYEAWRAGVHPKDQARANEDLQMALRSQNGFHTEFRVLWPDKSVHYIKANGLVQRDASGRAVHMLGTNWDITERKLAEESHIRLTTAIEQSAETTMITDLNGTILYVNPAFEKASGYTREEALGQNPRFLKSGQHDAEFYRKMWAVLGHGEVWSGRITNKKKDGTLYDEDASISPVRDAAGKVVNYVAVKRNVTHEAQLEAQLRQSQKMEAVGQLAGGVAHDFNNMLAIIRGNAELLLMDEEQFTAEAREGLEHVVAASERAANLTRQLLTFSRKQVMQPQPLLLNEVIANLSKMLRRVISEDINLQCHYPARLPHVQADTGMMEQVILNLVVNARDAMPAGGQLHVATEQVTLDQAQARVKLGAYAGEFVCLLVSDTGTGIAPEMLPRIFEPFFTTKEVGKGTGLGLATVYGIVQQHQGWIEVSSRVGQGTTFKVFLPAIPTPTRSAAAAVAGADIRGGKETILLVEDEHTVRLTTRRVLERKGYKVWEATSAQEALELWHSYEGEIALLLTDIIMPGEMSGRDLAERLWEQRPGLNVIFMSGYSADLLGKGTEFIRRTRSYFLQKPAASRTLLETVRRCLDEKAPGAAPEQTGGAK
jgi:PAS domain S-box-containing protein